MKHISNCRECPPTKDFSTTLSIAFIWNSLTCEAHSKKKIDN